MQARNYIYAGFDQDQFSSSEVINVSKKTLSYSKDYCKNELRSETKSNQTQDLSQRSQTKRMPWNWA